MVFKYELALLNHSNSQIGPKFYQLILFEIQLTLWSHLLFSNYTSFLIVNFACIEIKHGKEEISFYIGTNFQINSAFTFPFKLIKNKMSKVISSHIHVQKRQCTTKEHSCKIKIEKTKKNGYKSLMDRKRNKIVQNCRQSPSVTGYGRVEHFTTSTWYSCF